MYYCHWNVAVTNSTGMYVCTQSHSHKHMHHIYHLSLAYVCTHTENDELHRGLQLQHNTAEFASFPHWELPFLKQSHGSHCPCTFPEVMGPDAYEPALPTESPPHTLTALKHPLHLTSSTPSTASRSQLAFQHPALRAILLRLGKSRCWALAPHIAFPALPHL